MYSRMSVSQTSQLISALVKTKRTMIEINPFCIHPMWVIIGLMCREVVPEVVVQLAQQEELDLSRAAAREEAEELVIIVTLLVEIKSIVAPPVGTLRVAITLVNR